MKLPFFTCLLGASFAALAQSPLLIPVTSPGAAPKSDGDLSEWGNTGWIKIPVASALEKSDRSKFGLNPNDDKNQTGSLTVEMKTAVVGDRFFVVAISRNVTGRFA